MVLRGRLRGRVGRRRNLSKSLLSNQGAFYFRNFVYYSFPMPPAYHRFRAGLSSPASDSAPKEITSPCNRLRIRSPAVQNSQIQPANSPSQYPASEFGLTYKGNFSMLCSSKSVFLSTQPLSSGNQTIFPGASR